MSQVKLEQVKKEDLGGLSDQLGSSFEVVNRFMRQVSNILNGSVLFRDNVACVVKEVTLDSANFPIVISLGNRFPEKPNILQVVRVQGDTGVGNPAWEATVVEGAAGSEHAVKVHDVPGLTPGTKVTISLLIAAG